MFSKYAGAYGLVHAKNRGVSSWNTARFQLPSAVNERLFDYAPGSPERLHLKEALKTMSNTVASIPCVVNGKEYFTSSIAQQVIGCNHQRSIAECHQADSKLVEDAIKGALKAKPQWEAMPFHARSAIFLRAADLLATKYRSPVLAATMWGQGKSVWQAEIDAHAEMCDFWRFNCAFAEEIYSQQPVIHSPNVWNRLEYRPLEGFVVAISPFNFTAIGGNLPSAPALMGNVILWKPAASAILSNYLIYQCLKEAGLPDGVIQFLPGPAESTVSKMIQHPSFAGLHFTGSTKVFNTIWRNISQNLEQYHSYPRLVGETGGKNFHFVHSSADVNNVVNNTIRAAFEYQGQKCSATSRMYVPESLWGSVKEGLVNATKRISMGPVDDLSIFMSAVIDQKAFLKIKGYIDEAKANTQDYEVLVGGSYDDTKGFFISPTLLLAKHPQVKTMCEEIFGPVLTVYVYPDDRYVETLQIASNTSPYGLTGAIFANDRMAIEQASHVLRFAAGNLYINDKATGAVVGQQPFGGARASGTNDKAGFGLNLLRWTSVRTIKESFVYLNDFTYPSNLPSK